MRSLTFIIFLAVGLLGASKLLAADTNVVAVPKVAITNLLAHKELYKVRIIGTFDYRSDRMGVGRANGWPAQITNLEVFEQTE